MKSEYVNCNVVGNFLFKIAVAPLVGAWIEIKSILP